jgi:hypothetical protein
MKAREVDNTGVRREKRRLAASLEGSGAVAITMEKEPV